MKKVALIIAGMLLLTVVIFCIGVLVNQPEDKYVFNSDPGHMDGSFQATDNTPLPADYLREDSRPEMSIEDKLVAELKKYYGPNISEKGTQALLLKVKEFLVNLYPEDGEKRFYQILKRAFPDLADEIMVTLKKIEEYNQWLKDNALRLADMSELERKGTIWEKRRELFGEDVEDVFSDELYAYEQRKQTMKDTMRLLDESYDTTIEEKLDIYIQTLNETYGNSPEAYALENRGLLAQVFFGIESVQKDLEKMPPEQRQWEINQIRRQIGYNEEQIRKAEEIDAYRNKRWENGNAYMKERESLVQTYQGAALEEKLHELRVKYFKHEAETIKKEENDGFFRYKRPRVFGRN